MISLLRRRRNRLEKVEALTAKAVMKILPDPAGHNVQDPIYHTCNLRNNYEVIYCPAVKAYQYKPEQEKWAREAWESYRKFKGALEMIGAPVEMLRQEQMILQQLSELLGVFEELTEAEAASIQAVRDVALLEGWESAYQDPQVKAAKAKAASVLRGIETVLAALEAAAEKAAAAAAAKKDAEHRAEAISRRSEMEHVETSRTRAALDLAERLSTSVESLDEFTNQVRTSTELLAGERTS